MPPDLNTLPTSRPPSMPGSPVTARPRRISTSTQDGARPSPPSPRSPSLSSLQAAAAINAGLHRSPSRASPSVERRRSSLLNNLLLNDPTVPSPGELQPSSSGTAGSPRLGGRSFVMHTTDSHHQRQPSLGELHQELENEQEAQVNRLLYMIKVQQDQLAALQRHQLGLLESSPSSTQQIGNSISPSATSTPVIAAVTETSTPARSNSSPQNIATQQHLNATHSLSRRSPVLAPNPGSSGTSPALRPQAGTLGPLTEDLSLSGARDESAFYQAETQMLTRENQMLKLRIRELEHQITNSSGSTTGAHNQAHPHSRLASESTLATVVGDDDVKAE